MIDLAMIVVTAGALAGGFVSGLAGFGTGLVALGFWLHAIAPAPAASLVVICSVVSQLQTIPSVWHAIEPRRVLPFILPGLLGVPLGARLLADLDPAGFRLAVGALLVGFAAVMLVGGPRRPNAWGGTRADAAVGLASGVLGGLMGLSGALPTLWAALRGWTKDVRRSVFQAFNLSVLLAALLWHGATGLLTAEVGWLTLLALPGTLVGAQLGVRAYRRLSDRRFHVLILWLLGLSGATLLWNGLR